jgi:peptidoglycan/LPS O-acetylase OafA/YrhL
VLKTVKPDLATMEMLAYALLITIPLAMLSWHYVEAPVLRATRNWLSRQPRTAVKAAQA